MRESLTLLQILSPPGPRHRDSRLVLCEEVLFGLVYVAGPGDLQLVPCERQLGSIMTISEANN